MDGDGPSEIDGRAGDDTLRGGGGPDQIDEGDGHDFLSDGPRTASDDLEGGEGKGVLSMIRGFDKLMGGPGDDDLQGGTSSCDSLYGGKGNDRLTTFGIGGIDEDCDFSDSLRGGTGDDYLAADPNNYSGDRLFGDTGNDVLIGGAGLDTLAGGTGADQLSGGPARDTALYFQRTADQTITIDGLPDDGDASDGPPGARDNVGTDVEDLITGAGNDTIDSRDGNQGEITCGAGDDTLTKDPVDVALECVNVS